MSKRTIERLRKALTPFVGCDIDVDANVGRKRIVPYEDDSDEEERRLSFSYVDLFTGNVVISLHKDGHTYSLTPNIN